MIRLSMIVLVQSITVAVSTCIIMFGLYHSEPLMIFSGVCFMLSMLFAWLGFVQTMKEEHGDTITVSL